LPHGGTNAAAEAPAAQQEIGHEAEEATVDVVGGAHARVSKAQAMQRR
jgi:hypothetical protein